jgi:urea carboxylase
VRVDTWIETGTEITPFYDSLLGKLMVHGSSREDAVARMAKALQGTVLAGIPSNLEYLSTIIASEGFRAGARNCPFRGREPLRASLQQPSQQRL